jgi:hypothetical protein
MSAVSRALKKLKDHNKAPETMTKEMDDKNNASYNVFISGGENSGAINNVGHNIYNTSTCYVMDDFELFKIFESDEEDATEKEEVKELEAGVSPVDTVGSVSARLKDILDKSGDDSFHKVTFPLCILGPNSKIYMNSYL